MDFSMVPVGATNVGSIVVNFDKDLKTNDIYEHEVYSSASSVNESTHCWIKRLLC